MDAYVILKDAYVCYVSLNKLKVRVRIEPWT